MIKILSRVEMKVCCSIQSDIRGYTQNKVNSSLTLHVNFEFVVCKISDIFWHLKVDDIDIQSRNTEYNPIGKKNYTYLKKNLGVLVSQRNFCPIQQCFVSRYNPKESKLVFQNPFWKVGTNLNVCWVPVMFLKPSRFYVFSTAFLPITHTHNNPLPCDLKDVMKENRTKWPENSNQWDEQAIE